MHPANFPGAVEVFKPENMTDDQCSSIWAEYGFDKLLELKPFPIPPAVMAGIDQNLFRYFLTAWQPSKEDIEAINRGEPIYVKTLAVQLPPMSLFTLNANGEGNF